MSECTVKEDEGFKAWWQRNKTKVYIIGGVVLTVVAGYAIYKNRESICKLFTNLKTGKIYIPASKTTQTVAETITDEIVEPTYFGVSMAKLNELAKEVYHGLYCTEDGGFLIFHCKSNRGHQTFHYQLSIDEEGLIAYLGGNYPGQCWSSADIFAKRANERFTFNK